MRLGDLLAGVERIECHQAVYDELVHYLDKILQDGDEANGIPRPSGNGVVPASRISEVRERLLEKSMMLGDILATAEDAEVGNVELDSGDD